MSSAQIAGFAILAFSIILHEVSHGYVASLFGDTTAKRAGRLTLNPLPHVDPLGTIVLPALLLFLRAPFFIGWAKPVPIDPSCFKNYKTGLFAVSMAGPLCNFALALVFLGLFKRMPTGSEGAAVLFYGVSANVMLGLFNLVPIPPLDGSKAISVFLPWPARVAYLSIERWGFVILVALLYTGLLGKLLLPAYYTILTRMMG